MKFLVFNKDNHPVWTEVKRNKFTYDISTTDEDGNLTGLINGCVGYQLGMVKLKNDGSYEWTIRPQPSFANYPVWNNDKHLQGKCIGENALEDAKRKVESFKY